MIANDVTAIQLSFVKFPLDRTAKDTLVHQIPSLFFCFTRLS